jgi:hypothetical protein
MEPLLQWSTDYDHRMFHEIDFRVDKLVGGAICPHLVKQAVWFCVYACNGYLEHWLYTRSEIAHSDRLVAAPKSELKFNGHDTAVNRTDAFRAETAKATRGYLLPTFTYTCFNELKTGWAGARVKQEIATKCVTIEAEWAHACSARKLFEGITADIPVKMISCAVFDDQ